MKKLILYFILLLVPTFSFEQAGYNTSLQFKGTESALYTDFVPKFNTRPIELKGTRYFNEEFAHGELWLTSDRHYGTELLYKYDEYGNTVLIKFKNGKELYLPSNDIKKFKLFLEKDTLVFFRTEIPTDKSKERLFLIMYSTPKYKLIKLPIKKLRTVNDKIPYGSGEIYDELKSDYHYYLKIGNEEFSEVTISKKSLLKAFPKRKVQLKKIFDTPQYKKINEGNFTEILQQLEIM